MHNLEELNKFFDKNETISIHLVKIISYVNTVNSKTAITLNSLAEAALEAYDGASAILEYLLDTQNTTIENQDRFDICFYLYCHQAYALAVNEHLQTLNCNKYIRDVIKKAALPTIENASAVWRYETDFTASINSLFTVLNEHIKTFLPIVSMDILDRNDLIEAIDKYARKKLLELISNPSTWVYRYMQLEALKGQIDAIEQIPALIEQALLNFKEPFSTSSSKQAWSQYRQYLQNLSQQKIISSDFGIEKILVVPDYTYYTTSIQKPAICYYEQNEYSITFNARNIITLLTLLISTRTHKKNLICIFGKSGMGKTSLCQIYASRLAEMADVHPIYIPLKYINPDEDILNQIKQYISKIYLLGTFLKTFTIALTWYLY